MILHLHNRADADDTEHMLQMSDCLLIVVHPLTVDVNTSLLFVYTKFPVTLL